MIKRLFLIGILFFFFVYLIYFLVFPLYYGVSDLKTYWRIRKMPDFAFYQIENDTVPFLRSDLTSNKRIVIIFFNTNCEHCRAELEQLSFTAEEFEDTEFLLVSEQKARAIRGYLQEISLYGRSNVQVAISKNLEFIKKFGHKPIPTTYIYFPDKFLRKRIIGAYPLELLKEL